MLLGLNRRNIMNLTNTEKALDLNVSVPRSSRDTMAGIAHLPRMVDKARANRNETLGEYIYPCPLDQRVLKFLDTDPKTFAELADKNEDEQLTEWAREVTESHSFEERQLLNSNLLNRKPTPREMPHFLRQREKIQPGRTDVVTYVDLNDLEEGHI